MMETESRTSTLACSSISRWLSVNLLTELKKANGHRPLPVVVITGRFEDTWRDLKKSLEPYDDGELVIVRFHNEVGLNAGISRIDHRIVVDRAGVLRRKFLRIWHGKRTAGEYELDLGFSYYPKQNLVHIQMVSLGRNELTPLRGIGLMSETFELLVATIRGHYQDASISALCVGKIAEHWFKKYFIPKPLSAQIERTRIREAVRVVGDIRGRLMIGDFQFSH